MKPLAPILALAALLLGCQPVREGATVVARDLDLVGRATAPIQLTDHPHHVLFGHVAVIRQGGDTVRALVISQAWDGVHRLRYTAAWTGGARLPFASLAPARGGDCPGRPCPGIVLGAIFLGPAAFDAARREGLSARLTGPGGAIAIAAPPALFAAAPRIAPPS